MEEERHSAQNSERQTHLTTLTALRYLAAVLVIFPHLEMPELPQPLRGVLHHGSVGVGFFFVLSGFVLTWSMQPADSKRMFYRRRFARVYPLHLLTLMLSVGVALYEGTHVSVKAAPFALTLTQAWLPVSWIFTSFNYLSWSLSCEAFFYLVFPFIAPRIVALAPDRRRMLFVGLLGLEAVKGVGGQIADHFGNVNQVDDYHSAAWVAHWALYFFPPVRLIDFAIGIVLASAMREGYRIRLKTGQALLIALAVLTATAPLSVDLPVLDAIMIVPTILIILAGASRDVRGAPAQRPLFILLGAASFALYLIQQMVIRLIGKAFPHLFNGHSLPALVAAAALVVALTGMSIGLHLRYEVPLERRIRKGKPRVDSAAGFEDGVPQPQPKV